MGEEDRDEDSKLKAFLILTKLGGNLGDHCGHSKP